MFRSRNMYNTYDIVVNYLLHLFYKAIRENSRKL